MPLPKSIQRAAEQADAQLAQFAASNSAVDPNTGEPLTGAPQQPVLTEPAHAPAPVTQPDPFEQKFRSLQGKYDAEVPVLRQQAATFERINSQLSGQVIALNEELTRLKAAPPAPAAHVEAVRAVSDKDVEQYGGDLIDLMKRVAAAEADARGQALRGEVGQQIAQVNAAVSRTSNVVGEVKQSQKQTDRALYDQRLTEAVPNWREVNVDPQWLAWLAEFDPILGSTRQDALSTAYNAFDSVRTVAFLNTYLSQQRSTVASQPMTAREELARQVAPRSTPASAAVTSQPSAPSQKVWTQQEIGDAYRAKLQGKYKGQDAEWARISTEIDEAAASGRVR